MEGLRWILLGAGAVVVVLVYLVSRYQSSKPAPAEEPTPASEPRQAPALAEEPDEDVLREELARMESLVSEHRAGPELPCDGEQLIRLSVMAPPGVPFNGASLVQVFERCGLVYDDELQVCHRMSEDNGGARPVFSVTSAVKPGTFDWQQMDDFRTPGVSLFLQLPGPVEGVQAFDDMLTTAERLAAELGGELQDENHSVLTRQTVAHLRERIIEARVRGAARPPA